ncbi:hypothetical protein FGO68_gene1476 [Halteria grandinella]|uniref:Methyltransferase domain-containing protein n=1 Tax=Halteria grandinella TaxID=5974 RepID=A0A8J8NJM6_HALGN|nr:hypothetical protein FGO68_gene1476 [Halteria grandinella]
MTGLTDELKEEMKKHTGFSQDQIKEHYDEIAEKYDAIYLNAGYHDPLHCANLVKEFVPNTPGTEIFDMGCGTGLVGLHLKEHGYNKIVGCDASQGMLDVASLKGAYYELKELFLGKPDTYPQEFHGRFDAITAAGILAQGHLGVEVFEEFLLSVKKGGYIVFTTRTMYLEEFGYGKRIAEIEAEGRWKQVKEITFTRYDKLEEEVGRYRPVEVKAYAYQKLV